MDFFLLDYSDNWIFSASKESRTFHLKGNQMPHDRSSGKQVNFRITAVNFLMYSHFLTKPLEIAACQPWLSGS